tara:strand:- start:1330 stop:2046 length:717 start_codon:yes stop_codon:yes gene_type:complete
MITGILLIFNWTPPTKGFDNYKTSPFHPCIHNFGNTGFSGRIHAKYAIFATKIIDKVAYKGRNMRKELANGIYEIKDDSTSILEVGCGVGTLTKQLQKVGFYDITAIDTSNEMLEEARKNVKNVTFENENGAVYKKDVDLAIVSMVMHEMPESAHIKMTKNLLKCVSKKNGEVWIIDIDPSYKPSIFMKSGEPYVQDYLKNIEKCLYDLSLEQEVDLKTFNIVDNHVRVWVFRFLDTD